MGFIKYANVQSLGAAVFTAGQDGLRRVAAEEEAPSSELASFYLDGSRKLDVKAMLSRVAERYNISVDPADYLFEAIRANTVNVPNENHDGFHKSELLRFDPKYASPFGDRVGMPVYMTYLGKPHHLNHKADDPLRARGVILDAHYNDSSPALAKCAFGHDTSSIDDRDESGIHCRKCGSVVKDEFVEILVAVDTKKDPDLIRGIQAGVLNAGSMGCNCASTTCNVCNHAARTVRDFCEHIRGASKGTIWAREAGSNKDFSKLTSDDLRKRLKQAGVEDRGLKPGELVPVSLVLGDFEMRKAFEYCHGVEFDEYSRVYKPADPKALTIELLRAASAKVEAPLSIKQETELLIVQAKLHVLEAQMAKVASQQPQRQPQQQKQAQGYYAVRVNDNLEDVHVAATLPEAVKKAELGRRDRAEYLHIPDATSEISALTKAIAASVSKTGQYLPLEADVQLVLPDGMAVRVNPGAPDGIEMGPPGGEPGAPGVPGGGPETIQDLTQRELNPEQQQQSPEEFGMLPPGASAPLNELSAEGDEEDGDKDREAETSGEEDEMEQRFAGVYGDFEAEAFADRTIIHAEDGPVMTLVPPKRLASQLEMLNFAQDVLSTLGEDGLVRTAQMYNGRFHIKADVLEGMMDDMTEARPNPAGGVLVNITVDHKGPAGPAKAPSATEQDETDMRESRPAEPGSAIEDRETDMEEGADKQDAKSVVPGSDDDMEDKRPSYSMSDSTLEGAEFDMRAAAAARAVEARVKKLYTARLQKAEADLTAAKAEVEQAREAGRKEAMAQLTRAVKIASRRFALNHETSPLKARLVDSLTVSRPVGRSASTGEVLEFQGMDTDLALHLVEAAWAESAGEDVEAMLQRAAEFLSYDEKYLQSAEADLSKQAAVVPQVISEEQVLPIDEASLRAESMRRRASNGNLIFAPAAADLRSEEDKATQIRAALSNTKVGQLITDASRPN